MFSFETKDLISFILMRRMFWWCLITKRKEIIMWICVCPNRHMNFDSKKWWEEKLFLWNQASMLFSRVSRMTLWCPIMKKKRRLLCEYVFVLINTRTLIQKNGVKKSFSYETKASMSFSRISRTSLWFLIMKRKDIIIKSTFVPYWTNSTSKENGGKKSFLNETKSSMSFIPMRRISLWCPIMKKKDYYVNPCLSQLRKEL